MALTLAQFAMMGGDWPGSKAGTGYIKLPNGLIIQWGAATPPSNTGISITFPVAFPTGVSVITLGCNNSGAGMSTFQSQSATGFYLQSWTPTGGTAATTAHYIAIGY